jgi:predicted Rossmann-fold nucleotide-binding protein
VSEIESTEELQRALGRAEATGGSLRGWQVQGVDLAGVEDRIARLDPAGSLFLGSPMSPTLADHLRAGGALVFPELPDLPFDPWRAALYSPADLYDGLDGGYARSVDARIYAWSRQARRGDLRRLLAAALHDSSVDDALDEYAADREVVGVMGGHALGRDHPAYAEAALLGHGLAATGLTVATGGGPGAMEAANLGARLGDEDADVVSRAVTALATVPGFAPDVTAWARSALDQAELGDSGRSLGIPTWFYGHEPPNAFASVVAKYFRNAIREDVLLQVCRRGIVFLPGAAGTVQEVFQVACANYYAEPGLVAPMVFVGERYWTEQLPVWQLVDALGAGRPLAAGLHLVDDPADVLAALAPAPG